MLHHNGLYDMLLCYIALWCYYVILYYVCPPPRGSPKTLARCRSSRPSPRPPSLAGHAALKTRRTFPGMRRRDTEFARRPSFARHRLVSVLVLLLEGLCIGNPELAAPSPPRTRYWDWLGCGTCTKGTHHRFLRPISILRFRISEGLTQA